jgi:hypothetical protein
VAEAAQREGRESQLAAHYRRCADQIEKASPDNVLFIGHKLMR